jgi:aryl-phospho-beta-D-glucosidase BglC (GH1 family)
MAHRWCVSVRVQNSTIDYITNVKRQYVLLDVHNYFRYRGQLIGSANVSFTAFTKFWQKLAGLYVGNSRLIFGTMNEPNGVSALTALTGANAAIAGIRASGAKVCCVSDSVAQPPDDIGSKCAADWCMFNVPATDHNQRSHVVVGRVVAGDQQQVDGSVQHHRPAQQLVHRLPPPPIDAPS